MLLFVVLDDTSIYPLEIETYLNKHENVRESCVFGIPINKYEELICAWIILKDAGSGKTDVQEIIQFCLDNFAENKMPKAIKFVESLPKTAFGRVDRSLIATLYRAEIMPNN